MKTIIIGMSFGVLCSCSTSEVSEDIDDAFDSIEENQKNAEIVKLERDSLKSISDADSGTYSFDHKQKSGLTNVDSLREEDVEVVIMNAH